MTHVMIMSVGPVQEFIAGGRKCRDLWFGSWLLSEVAVAAAKAIQAQDGGRHALVFPGGLAENRDTSAANKIVARVADPRSAALAAEKAVQSRVLELAREAFARVGVGDQRRKEHFFEGKALDQVNDLLECLWAHAEETGPDGYDTARGEAERLLAARKNSKQWTQPSWAAAGVPKSSLDGVRESVLHESLFDEPRNGAKSAPITEETVRRMYGVHGAERLCGIGVFKRFGRRSTSEGPRDKPERVFSTSHVAALPFLDGLEHRPGGKEAFKQLVDRLDGIDPRIVGRLDVVPGESHPVSDECDGAILFPGRLQETAEEALSKREWKEKKKDVDAALAAFLREYGEPSPYFAVLLADGDHMGKAIDKLVTVEKHRELSNKLETFASSAREIVGKHGGSLIYSGGDDVLAFVPLHKVLSCATALADDFSGRLREFAFTDDQKKFAPTLSMGIALVHALVPLDESLEEARKAEKSAKAVEGKDALAIRVVKRGGEAIEIAGKRATVARHLERFVGWHSEGQVSSKAQYALMDLERLSANEASGEMKSLIEGEATRIIDRRRASGGAEATEKIHAHIHDAIHDLGGPAKVGRALYVAQLLSRAIDQSKPPKPTTSESAK